jgi:polyhydroxybutyrate depolymerase
MTLLRALPLLLLAACLPDLPTVSDPCGAWPDGGGLYRLPFEAPDSRTRHPYVYVPSGKGPRDVVFLLHGRGSSGPSMAEVTGFLDEADRRNLVLVYPNGLGFPKEWNAGPQFRQTQDDVAFLESLAAELDDRVCARRRVAVGFSNGMMMAHRWACEGEALDAIGGSAGPLMTKSCGGDPMPMRQYQGAADPVIPIDGGPSFGVQVPSLSSSMALWRERNQCDASEPEVTVTGDTTCTRWQCAAPTEQCVVAGWPHRWPGGVNGASTDADATAALLEFFRTSVPLDDADLPRPE